jgi:adenylosuccinate lyase
MTEEMKTIWTDEHKYKTWLKVELAVLRTYANHGIIPRDDYEVIKAHAKVDAKRISELEDLTHHDVIAFTRAVSETLGIEKKWVHYGLTSTDVVDTANALMLKEANELIEKALIGFTEELKNKALQYKYTPCIGRTHGIHGEITSFGLKWLLFYDEALRDLKRFRDVREEIERGKLSGAVGNFANLDPEIEEETCSYLKISHALVSTQVLSRDFHIQYMNTLALIASLIEKIATEVRHLSRTEVREAEEYFDSTQKGSSAMPHKRNPIASENMCGCSRIVRGYLTAAYDDNILWHERDISHSAAERIMLPDATELIHYMLTRYSGVIHNLAVYPQRMMRNIMFTHGVIFSGKAVGLLIKKGLSRETAYDLVQKYAIMSYNEEKDFRELLKNSRVMEYVTQEELESCFSVEDYLKNVDKIYSRFTLGGIK